MLNANSMKSVYARAEHRLRLERLARQAAYSQQRAGARIRWVAAVLAGLVVVGSGVLLTTVSSTSQPRPVALSPVSLEPATALPPTPASTPTASASSLPASVPVAAPAFTMSATATRSIAAQKPPQKPPVPAAPNCPAAGTSTLNDDAAGITYSGSWRPNRNRGYGDFHDDVHYTNSNGDSVSYSFTGTGISLFTETFRDEGRMDVYLDGQFQRTVDTTSETRRVQQIVFKACGLQAGFHNIRAVKRSGDNMLIDRLDVTP
jgi:hypothetical protein